MVLLCGYEFNIRGFVDVQVVQGALNILRVDDLVSRFQRGKENVYYISVHMSNKILFLLVEMTFAAWHAHNIQSQRSVRFVGRVVRVQWRIRCQSSEQA